MNLELRGIVERDALSHIGALLEDEPAIMVEGPRGSGKSTLLRQLTRERDGHVLDLDDPATASLVALDPAGALQRPGLHFVDEYQRAPELLSIVKGEIDRGAPPGRFLLAGSVSGRLLPTGTETLTGRIHRLTLPVLSVGEVLGQAGRLLPHLVEGADPNRTESDLSRRDYFELVAAGGFPAALARRTPTSRRRWFASYLATVADRDLPQIVEIRHPGALLRLYRLVAEQTSCVVARASLGVPLAINPATARSYLDLLERVYLVGELPSWTVGVSAKVARRPKVYVTDTGLGAAAVGLDAGRLATSSAGGGFLESFVLMELFKQSVAIDLSLSFAHFRDRSGVEVDIVVERPDGGIVGFEVKSATMVTTRDAAGLRFLRDRLGSRFLNGIVLHTGPRSALLEDRIWALPIASLWATPAPGEV